ncbi:hypothetical protein [Frateuria defendens]|uniref:hypothetical protein n=1 Tax=Frateuria defendens TaxID=2219559 RepID=UPI00066FCB0C|nr:hypothetical protein [Frateuria defendens]
MAELLPPLHLRPGRWPAITGARRLPLGQLLQGRPAAAVPALMGQLFSLCAGAQSQVAQWALALAQGQAAETVFDLAARHRLVEAAMREHLRHILLDWPRCLGAVLDAPAAQEPLRRLWQAPPGTPGDWLKTLQACLYGEPPETWLARRMAGAEAMRDWLHRAGTAPARTLAACAPGLLAQPLPAAAGVESLLFDERIAELARQAWHEPDFAVYPQWHGTRETGCWQRLARRRAMPGPSTVLERLLDRLEEVARLATGDARLHSGGGALEPGCGYAWTETARGVLLHVAAQDAAGRVAGYRAVAPTEWNFHPHGSLAGCIAALPAGDAARCAALAAAFDPCLAFTVAPACEVAAHA